MEKTSEDVKVPDTGFADDNAEKRHIVKNLLVVSFGFLFLFTAFQSLSNLQSSLNQVQGLGVVSLSVIYGALIVSCMFVPPLVIDKLGCKWTIAGSILCYCTYIAANYKAIWATMIPTSIILGTRINKLLLTSSKVYITYSCGISLMFYSYHFSRCMACRFAGEILVIF